MVKLVFYVPPSHLERVKQAIFDAGAGKQGDYDNCCWQILGQGQFRALPGSKPFIGDQGKTQCLDEYCVEAIVMDHKIADVVRALKTSHPYEEPAYGAWQMLDL